MCGSRSRWTRPHRPQALHHRVERGAQDAEHAFELAALAAHASIGHERRLGATWIARKLLWVLWVRPLPFAKGSGMN